MRKCAVCFVIILIAGLAGSCLIHGQVRASEEKVNYATQVLYGDASAAKGLTVQEKCRMGGHLFWDCSVRPADHDADTEFVFSSEYREERGRENSFELFPYNGFSVSESELESNPDLYAAVQQTAEATSEGSTQMSSYLLGQCMDSYPITVNLSVGDNYCYADSFSASNDESGMGKRLRELFDDFFHIPVKTDSYITISVSKDESGEVVDLTLILEDEPVKAVPHWDGNTCYFVFQADDGIDAEHMAAAPGVYCLSAGGNDLELEFVCPLEDKLDVWDLEISEDKKYLEVYGQQGETAELLLLRRESGEIVRTIPLGAGRPDLQKHDKNLLLFKGEGDSMALVAEEDDASGYEVFSLSCSDAGEKWHEDVTGVGSYQEMFESEDVFCYSDIEAMAWNGTQLALVGGNRKNVLYGIKNTSFAVYIVDADGLQYLADCACSLDLFSPSAEAVPSMCEAEAVGASW